MQTKQLTRFGLGLLLFTLVLSGGLLSSARTATAAKPTKRGGVPTNTPVLATATTVPANCYKPLGVTSDIDGYAEGSLKAQGGYMNGKEITYNFATFQRKSFSSKMDVGTATRNAGNYVETIDGFVTNQAAPTDYTQFRAQYEFFNVQIQIDNNSLAANAPIWSAWTNLAGRKGTVHFATSATQNPMPIPISGDQAFV